MRCREGDGPVAQRLRKRLTPLVLEKFGGEIRDFRFWTQPGDYRKVTWDLARWGADLEIDHGTWTQKIALFSWNTMTECARAKYALTLTHDGAGTYDVCPVTKPKDSHSESLHSKEKT